MVSLCGSSSGEGASANPGDGPGSASPISGHFAKAPRDELLAYMESCHKGSWHSALNNHASTRPKKYGGPTVPSVQNCKTFTEPGAASTTWQCVLDLPNSFTKNDGIRLRVSCEASTKAQVDEDVCRLAFTYLLMESPEQVILRPSHWNVSIEDLLKHIPDYISLFCVPPHQALPVHVNASRTRMDGEAAGERLSLVWEGRVVELLRDILRCHGGSFDPSHICHKWMGRGPEDEKTYKELNRLLQPNELKPFVERHPEFVWYANGKNGMIIQWA